MPLMIRDIRLDDEFFSDYDCAPEQAQKAVDKLIRMISDSGRFPTSMRLHKMHKLELWGGYVTVTGQHWRLLLYLNDDGTVTFHRLMRHDDYSDYLRALAE